MWDMARYQAEILAPLGEVVVDMERRGVPFDVPAARELLVRIREDEARTRAALTSWVYEMNWTGPEFPPNWGSWKQLQTLLYTPAGLNLRPSPYWSKGSTGWREDGTEEREGEGELKTDNRALLWLAGEYPEHAQGLALVRELRWVTRAAGYVEGWLEAAVEHDDWWWLHPSFGLAGDHDDRPGAVTGRFAVKNPALQQVPAHGDNYGLRSLFRAPPGLVWVVMDYSQLEVVLLAHICNALFGTRGLLDRVTPGAPDMHSVTARYVYGEVLGDERIRSLAVEDVKREAKDARDAVKAIRYGLNYGKGARGFGDTIFDSSGRALGEARAQAAIDALFRLDPEIPRYQDGVRTFITKHRGIPSLFGRWLPLPDAASPSKGPRNRAWRRALNFPMQAGGQEVTVLAMTRLQRAGVPLCLQVHDELCALAPERDAERTMQTMKHHMTQTCTLRAPLQVSGGYGPSWGEAKS